MAKKKKFTDRKVHKMSFKKEPIWLKMNMIGRYEGIKYRFTFREYCNEELEEVVKSFTFMWPGRIPENKALAEKGIKAMFLKQLDDGTVTHRVIYSTLDKETDKAEESELYKDYDNIV